jgi:hypothetical protein
MATLIFPTVKHDRTGGRVIITSPMGPRWGGIHYGSDVGTTDGMDAGTPVVAEEDLEIVHTGDARPNGAGVFQWTLTDRQERNQRGQLCWVGYKSFHLEGIVVHRGRVTIGTVIARAGNTGTGAVHLHKQKHLLPVQPGPRVPMALDWSDRTAVSHTAELQWLIDTNAFVGETPTATTPEPGDDDMALTDADLDRIADRVRVIARDEINTVQAQWERDTRAEITQALGGAPVVSTDFEGLWLIRSDADGQLTRAWIDGTYTLQALRDLGVATRTPERHIPATVWKPKDQWANPNAADPDPDRDFVENPTMQAFKRMRVVPLFDDAAG